MERQPQNKKGEQIMSCFFCKGDIEKGTTNYVVNFDNCIIIIKNVPCDKCSQCGEVYFDDDIVMKLEAIINKMKTIVSEVAVFEYEKLA